MVLEMSIEEFQDGPCGSHLGYRNGTILAILILFVSVMLPIKFWLNLTYSLGEVVWRISKWWPPWISEQNQFSSSDSLCHSDASHQVLAQSDLLGGDVVWRISRWRPRWPSWISERNDFSNSESLCCSDASHHVSAQSDLWFGRRCRLKNFKVLRPSWISEQNDLNNSESLCPCNASHQVLAQSDLRFGRRCCLKNFKMDGGHLGYRIRTILAILNLYVTVMPPTKFKLNQTYAVWEEMSFEEFQDGSHLGYLNKMILAILILCVTVMPPTKFQLNWTYSLGGDVVWRISRWQPSWISELNNFSKSESPCCHNASQQVSTQSNLRVWRRCWKYEKLTTDDGWRTAGHGISWPRWAYKYLCTSFRQKLTTALLEGREWR